MWLCVYRRHLVWVTEFIHILYLYNNKSEHELYACYTSEYATVKQVYEPSVMCGWLLSVFSGYML